MSTLLMHAWYIDKSGDEYYLPYTHWIYLTEIVKYYDEICLLSPVIKNDNALAEGQFPISPFGKIKVYELPASKSYVSAITHFSHYIKAYKKLTHYDRVYVRYPVPFGWLNKLFFKKKRRIIHFVGDPIDVTKTNPNFSPLKKAVLITFFMPEHLAYMWACKGANVYTNGHHIKDKLTSYGIKAEAVISSTLKEQDFYYDENKPMCTGHLKILYAGYLRKWKGVEYIIKAFNQIHQQYPNAQLTIAGAGEFEKELKDLVQQLNLQTSTHFVGHVEKREDLNNYYRTHHIFCLASLAEGSPRVILEAMANGLNVISTPVGSLPSVFADKQDLLFAKFNDDKEFVVKINTLLNDKVLSETIRRNAYNKVRNFTIENFIKNIFQ